MKLSISNIAWSLQEDEKISDILDELSIPGVEIAPTKIWVDPLNQNGEAILDYRTYWNQRNREIVALQSLLFGRPDLTIFKDQQKREETYQYLASIIALGANLGAKAYVFGSPKNRLIGDMPFSQAMDVAVPFFKRLGEIAANYGSTFCIEPNPKEYGCDFICDTKEGIELVKKVAHPGFGLHLDSAAMTLNQENIVDSLNEAFPYIAHFHVSEPYLQRVKNGTVDHQTIAKQLRRLNYKGFISIEMRDGLTDSNLITVRESLQFVHDLYFG